MRSDKKNFAFFPILSWMRGVFAIHACTPINLFWKDFNVKKQAKRDSQLLRKEVKKLNVIL